MSEPTPAELTIFAGVGPCPMWVPPRSVWLQAPRKLTRPSKSGKGPDGLGFLAWVSDVAGRGATTLVIPRDEADFLAADARLTDLMADIWELVEASPERGLVFSLVRDRQSAPSSPETAVREFSTLYFGDAESTSCNTHWLGTAVQKCPLDLWVYQEILTELRPDLIIEAGTGFGGRARFLATVCDALGVGEVLTIDIAPQPNLPQHPRITPLTASSTAPDAVAAAARRAERAQTVMVILDSDHSRDHVLAELRAYAPLVSPGSYLIVEDTIVNGHPVLPDFGPGPWEAVEAFLAENDAFEVDRAREKFKLTRNPGGYLRRR